MKQTNIKNPSCKVNKAVYLQVGEWFTNKQRQRTAGSSISIIRIAESDVLGDYSFEAGIRPLSTGQLCLYFRCSLSFFQESKGKKPTRAYLDGVAVKLGKAAPSQQL